jgi:hypothetical protein
VVGRGARAGIVWHTEGEDVAAALIVGALGEALAICNVDRFIHLRIYIIQGWI